MRHTQRNDSSNLVARFSLSCYFRLRLIRIETEGKGKREQAWKEGFAKALLDFYLPQQSPSLEKQPDHLQRYGTLRAVFDAT